MGRAPCCDNAKVKRGPWAPEEDAKLKDYIHSYGTGGNWIALPHKIGLNRCGKSCRLRWLNYLRPNIKHGDFTEEEDNIILNLYISIGSRWSIIAAQLPERTDNDIKNYWNTRLKKKLLGKRKQQQGDLSSTLSSSALERLELHMQLWPDNKLGSFTQDRLIKNNNFLPNMNHISTSSETSNGVNYMGMDRVSSFQPHELHQILSTDSKVNEIDGISGWWSNDSNSTNWDFSTNLQSGTVLYQDYGN